MTRGGLKSNDTRLFESIWLLKETANLVLKLDYTSLKGGYFIVNQVLYAIKTVLLSVHPTFNSCHSVLEII